jgi:hypothetical protein
MAAPRGGKYRGVSWARRGSGQQCSRNIDAVRNVLVLKSVASDARGFRVPRVRLDRLLP